MDSFKKIISLNQASKMSGYSQDYLGFLIRKGEMKGLKKGRTWFTTEEEVKNYIFKKKVRHDEFAFKDFFTTSRTKKIIIMTVLFFIFGFLIISNLNKTNLSTEVIKSPGQSDGAALKID